MRVMMKVSIPVGAGNRGIKEGTLPKTILGFMDQFKPEAAYFLTEHGKRTAFFFVDLKEPSAIPVMAEPFFKNFEAEIECTPAMNVEEMKAGVAKVSQH